MKARARRRAGARIGSSNASGVAGGRGAGGTAASTVSQKADAADLVAPNVLTLRPATPTRPVALPPTLGQFLRQKRDASRRTLAEVAGVTRISQRTLRKLEADEDGLPADVFVRGYLRSCARVCGFDGDEAVRLFEQQRKEAAAPVEAPVPAQRVIRRAPGDEGGADAGAFEAEAKNETAVRQPSGARGAGARKPSRRRGRAIRPVTIAVAALVVLAIVALAWAWRVHERHAPAGPSATAARP